MLSRLLVNFYVLVHGRLKLPGAGWALRRLRSVVPGLRAYPFDVPGVGTAIIDFQDDAAYGLINFSLGELDNNAALFRFLEQVLKPGSVLWDVGSNIGFICIYFADARHGLAAIHAFEPNPVALKPLQTLFKNHPKVKVHPIGLGATDAELMMNVVPSGSLLSSLVRPVPNAKPLPVQIRRGDEYWKQHGVEPPDVIKIDVEGYEPQVLAGLSEVVSQFRPIIFFEHLFLSDTDIEQLRPPNYSIVYILDDGGLADHRSKAGPSHDAILLPEEKKVRLRG